MPKVSLPPCRQCGEEPRLVKSGISFYIVPRRVKNCRLNKKPVKRLCGSVVSQCRTGFASTKEEAGRQWIGMQRMVRAGAAAFKKTRQQWGKLKGIKPVRDEAFKAWVRDQPCLICCLDVWVKTLNGEFSLDQLRATRFAQSTPTEAAHMGRRGLRQKSSDRECVPLCAEHHREGKGAAHQLQKRFWFHYSLDQDDVIDGLNALYRMERL